MLRRMRSRLFVSFLSVSLLAMIPLVVVPYFITSSLEETYRENRMREELQRNANRHNEFKQFIEHHVINPVADRLINSTFETHPELRDLLVDMRLKLESLYERELLQLREQIQQAKDQALIHEVFIREMQSRLTSAELTDPFESQIRTQILRDLQNEQIVAGEDFRLLDVHAYIQWRRLLDEPSQLSTGNEEGAEQINEELKPLIEENGEIYFWVLRKLELEVDFQERPILIGGLLVLFPYIDLERGEDGRIDKIAPMLADSSMDVVMPATDVFRPSLSYNQFERLFDENEDGFFGNVYSVRLSHPQVDNGEIVQANLLPFINQNRELIAIGIVSEPVIDFLEPMAGLMVLSLPSTLLLIMIVATFVARSLSRPIGELAEASQTMAEGRFDVRVPVSGTEEQRVLSSAFNRMAQRIEQQMAQLQRQTSELEESNQQLNQTHRFLQNVLANISTGVLSVDREGKIHHLNPVGENLFGVSDWAGKPFQESIPSPVFVQLVVGALHSRKSLYRHEQLCPVGDGKTIIPLQISIVTLREQGDLGGLVVTFHDLSEIRRLEDQVRRQDRLAALGRMSAGVAHEIRNPLGIIRGSAQLLQKRFGDQPGEEGLCEFIIEEVQRLSRVVNDFLMFARPPVPNKEKLTVEELFAQLETYMQSESEKHHYTTRMESPLPDVSIDPGLFREAFLNLFINAQEAMPDGGEIVVRARSWANETIAIEVSDSGMGMDAEQMDRIFDPFYTSKDNGTGLGLSLVHQIISSHGGTIEAESTAGKGSTFRVILPTSEQASRVKDPELASTA